MTDVERRRKREAEENQRGDREKESVSNTAIKYSDKHRSTGKTYRRKFSMLR